MKIYTAFIFLVFAMLTTAVAGYRYVTRSDRDATVQTAFHLGQSAGNLGTHEKLETLVRGDKDASVAGQNGLDSLEPANIDTASYFPR